MTTTDNGDLNQRIEGRTGSHKECCRGYEFMTHSLIRQQL